jgi:hypothetical protein
MGRPHAVLKLGCGNVHAGTTQRGGRRMQDNWKGGIEGLVSKAPQQPQGRKVGSPMIWH